MFGGCDDWWLDKVTWCHLISQDTWRPVTEILLGQEIEIRNSWNSESRFRFPSKRETYKGMFGFEPRPVHPSSTLYLPVSHIPNTPSPLANTPSQIQNTPSQIHDHKGVFGFESQPVAATLISTCLPVCRTQLPGSTLFSLNLSFYGPDC